MHSKLRALVAIILTSFMASESFAVGSASIGNEVLSARSLGQGGVSVAGATEDQATVYSNPAGLTALKGTQVTLGGTWENIRGNYEDATGIKGSSMRLGNAFVPNFALTQSCLDSKLGFGLGAFSTYGLETHWPGDPGASLRYIATNSALHIIDITPTVAYQVLPILSVGVGADYVNLTTAELEKNVNMNNLNNGILKFQGQPPAFAGLPDGDSKLDGEAASWGYHAGLMFHPTEQHSFGLVYHSRVKLNVNGSVDLTNISGAAAQAVFGGSNYTTTAYTDTYLPQNIQLGYSFKPNDKWQFEADAAWYDWTPDKGLDIRYPALNPSNPADAAKLALLTNGGSGNPTPLNWHNTWSLETGANYKYNDQIQLRWGFFYEPSVIPESAFSPDLPDLTRYGLAVGTSYALTPVFLIEFGYNAVFEHSRTITNTIGVDSTGDPTVTANGSYKVFVNALALNFTYKFGQAK